MRSRGLVVAIAVVLAILAAVGVIVYTSNVRETAVAENTSPVIASSQDIPAGTQLDGLIAQGVFRTINVPSDQVVPNVVTDTTELQGQTTSAPIYENEQIPLARLSTGQSNNLGISPGNVGLGLEVTGSAAVNGYIQQGDHVVLYATFGAGTLVTRQSLKFYLSGAQINRLLQAAGAATTANANAFVMPVDFTVTLVPSIKVLAVANPPVDTTTGKSTAGTSTFVLDLAPADASNIVYATDHSTLYMALLPPDNEDGYPAPGVAGAPFGRVVGVK
jgi:Flp pilus assembly protein CpaB